MRRIGSFELTHEVWFVLFDNSFIQSTPRVMRRIKKKSHYHIFLAIRSWNRSNTVFLKMHFSYVMGYTNGALLPVKRCDSKVVMANPFL